MNVPFTFSNKQPLTPKGGGEEEGSGDEGPRPPGRSRAFCRPLKVAASVASTR